jgi:hypothetical protein
MKFPKMDEDFFIGTGLSFECIKKISDEEHG